MSFIYKTVMFAPVWTTILNAWAIFVPQILTEHALFKLLDVATLKGNLRSKKSYAQMKERKNAKEKQAITDLNAPNGSRDIQFHSQKFGQGGHRHFVGFQPHFQFNMTMKKMKV